MVHRVVRRHFPVSCPGALKTLGASKDAALPVRLFELSDVVLPDAAAEAGARNERRLAAVQCGRDSGFEAVHGLLNRLMEALDVPLAGAALPARVSRAGLGYSRRSHRLAKRLLRRHPTCRCWCHRYLSGTCMRLTVLHRVQLHSNK